MSSTPDVGTFEDRLEEHEGNLVRTGADGFEAALADLLEEPAVGAPLPFEGVDYGDLQVAVGPTPSQLESAATGVTAATLGIADYGTVVLASAEENTEGTSLYPETHVAVLAESDLVADMPAAFERLDAAFADGLTSAVLATGPSATADMGALVYGAHGPRAVHVLLLTDR